MGEDSTTGALIFVAGLLTGIFAYTLITNKPQQQVMTQQPQALTMSPYYAEYEHMKVEIQRLTEELWQIRQENIGLRAQIMASQPRPAVKETPKIQEDSLRKDIKPLALQNEETWEIKKDKRGRLEGVTVHRKVTSGA